ncbi:MAG: hypothetical protein QW270_08535 [Candidatus Bathyarchaeia archaeon]
MTEAQADQKIEGELKGNTLRVYLMMLKSTDGVGVREVQRSLGFSSPTLAVYHLEKPCELGLVEKRHGEYYLAKIVKVGVLKQFVKFGFLMLPRYVFYATMFTALLVLYLSKFEQINFYSLFALIFGVLGTAIFWYETFRIWRQKP